MSLAAAWAGFLVTASWPFSVDDAYILARYGRHLATGHGLAWNPGGPPVEGYTNTLYVLLSAPLSLAGVDPVLPFKLLGLMSLAAVAWLSARLVERAEPGAGPWAAVLLLASPGLTFWSVAGLETLPAAALLVGAVLLFERREDAGAAAVFGVMSLLRTEAPAWAVLLAAARAVELAWPTVVARWPWPAVLGRWTPRAVTTPAGGGAPEQTAEARARPLGAAVRALRPWLVLGAALVAFQLWRTAYFGVSLPNPVLFKSTLSVEGAGQSVLVPFAETWWPLLVAAAVGLWLSRRWLWGAVALLAVPVFATATTSAHGSSTVAFFDRYLLPVVPVVVMLAAVAVQRAARWRLPAGAALGLGLWGWTSFNPVVNVTEVGSLALSHRDNVRPATTALATFIRAERPAGYRLALGDVGYVGWRLDRVIDDLYGLNDYTYTVQCRGNLDVWVEALLSRAPDGVVMVMRENEGTLRAAHAVEQRLYAHPAFAGRYRRVRDFQAGTNPWRYVLFER